MVTCDSLTMSTLPPGPASPPLAQTMAWLTRPIQFLEACRRHHGDAFSVRFLGFSSPMVMLSDPEAIRALYTERANGLPPGRSDTLLPVVGPDSVLLLQGEQHLARRRLMLPPFHGERMRAYESTVASVTEREIGTWPRDEAFALHPRMQAVTLEVILGAVFGVTDPERREALRIRLPRLAGGSSSAATQMRILLARRLGYGDPLAALRKVLEPIDELLLAEIAEHRADPDGSQREDILAMMVAARFEDGSAMSDQELRDQCITLLLAGHETTATALAWAFDQLLANPAVLERLIDEIDEGTSDEYLRAVVSETLRLRPVVPLAGRRLGVDLEVGDLHLPAGADVTPAIWLTHTRPDLYPEPYAFRPERFLENPPTTYGWIPFGGGVRRCLGAAFAELEARVVLQTVLRECDLRAASTRPETITRRNVTLAPRHGTRVRSAPRTVRAPQPVAA
jgi:cytochrome P450 family 135